MSAICPTRANTCHKMYREKQYERYDVQPVQMVHPAGAAIFLAQIVVDPVGVGPEQRVDIEGHYQEDPIWTLRRRRRCTVARTNRTRKKR